MCGVNTTGVGGVNIGIYKVLIISALRSRGINMVCKSREKQAHELVRAGR
jgi:hypothetical protein